MKKENKALVLLQGIDYGLLREQKTEIINMLDKLVLSDDQKAALNGILVLFDSIQDFAVDEMEMDEMVVFNLNSDEKPKEFKSVHLCAHCASDNIQFKAWVNPNEEDEIEYFIDDSNPEEDNYCNDCGTHGNVFTDDIPINKHVIGYQVIHVLDKAPLKTEFHPNVTKENQVFNLKQAKYMIEDNPEIWQLFTIWSGDFDSPEIIFKGEPR